MKLFALVYKEHYEKYCELHGLTMNNPALQAFLKDIGVPSICFQKPSQIEESNYVSYDEVPEGSCVRLLQPNLYTAVIHEKLFPVSHEKPDKSRRSSSCAIV